MKGCRATPNTSGPDLVARSLMQFASSVGGGWGGVVVSAWCIPTATLTPRLRCSKGSNCVNLDFHELVIVSGRTVHRHKLILPKHFMIPSWLQNTKSAALLSSTMCQPCNAHPVAQESASVDNPGIRTERTSVENASPSRYRAFRKKVRGGRARSAGSNKKNRRTIQWG